MVKEKHENESKGERFKRLATIRAQKVLEKLRVLGNCSNTGLYEYDDEDIKKIFTAIEKELRRTKLKFEKPEKIHFDL
jgi:hypothetical protein